MVTDAKISIVGYGVDCKSGPNHDTGESAMTNPSRRTIRPGTCIAEGSTGAGR